MDGKTNSASVATEDTASIEGSINVFFFFSLFGCDKKRVVLPNLVIKLHRGNSMLQECLHFSFLAFVSGPQIKLSKSKQ